MHFNKLIILIGIIWSCCITAAMAATTLNHYQNPDSEDAYLVVNFKNNTSQMDDDAKAVIHEVFGGFVPQAQEKIIVVGYTDNAGQSKNNDRLSYRRARAVREELINTLGLPPTSVLALGKGEQNPVADNKNAEGRSNNRRVEIYFAQMVNDRIMKTVKDRKPPVSRVEALIEEARRLVRMRQLAPALRTLAEAKAAGGDQLSNWHAVYGIGGYYAGLPAEKITAHLMLALRLDTYNSDARAFLGRMTARKKIAQGHIPPSVGMTPETAIVVSHKEEIYEYLRLLKFRPKKRTTLPHRSLEVWNGIDESGNQVNYYFNYSHTLDWAFDRDHGTKPTAGIAPAVGPSPSTLPLPTLTAPANEAQRAEQSIPTRIWTSEIYR